MTEKRFKIDLDEEAITDNGEYCLSLYCFQDKGEKDVCDLLNELNEENEELKQFKEDFIKMLEAITSAYVDLLNESWEENEQLKQQRDFYYARLQKIIKVANGDV